MMGLTIRVVPVWNVVTALALLAVLSGCGPSYKRGPAVPEDLGDVAVIPGIPKARVWGDEPPSFTEAWLQLPPEELEKHYAGIMNTEHTYLAVSGGGSRGAFAAGLLVGWSERGTRPEFTMVTGISTGALIAPLAFLGSEHNETLREIYTSYSTKDMVSRRSILQILQNDAATDTTKFKRLVRHYYHQGIMAAVAREHRRGRDLLIATVNLDAERPVIWNMGFIADSGHPGALKLFQDVIIASAAIPAVFPPVYFDVEAEGESYQEMHVDGGAIQQIFLYPAGIDWAQVTEKLRVRGAPRLYMIRNSRMLPNWQEVKPTTLNIAARATAALYRSESIGDLYRLYVNALDDGMDYNLAFIPAEFEFEEKEPFDREYMVALFNLGRRLGQAGYEWKKEPPEIIAPK